VQGLVRVRRDSTNFGSHPPKQGAEEFVVKQGVWVDVNLRERLTGQHHECCSSSLLSDGRAVHNRGETRPEKSSAIISTLKALLRDG
jgi:hypothetical protein